jgi:hypothetical protein
MQNIINQNETGSYYNEKVEQLLTELSRRLKNTGGKKVYGYLKSDVKSMIDSIVDELSKDERLSKLYDMWYDSRYAVLKTYTDILPPKLPLSQQKEFKSIKNMVIAEALQLSDHHFILNEVEVLVEEENLNNKAITVVDVHPQKDISIIQPNKPTSNNLSTLHAVTRLFQYCSRILTDEANTRGKQENQMDKKLRREIDEKKQAMGIRM